MLDGILSPLDRKIQEYVQEGAELLNLPEEEVMDAFFTVVVICAFRVKADPQILIAKAVTASPTNRKYSQSLLRGIHDNIKQIKAGLEFTMAMFHLQKHLDGDKT